MKVLFSLILGIIFLHASVSAQISISGFPLARETFNMKSLALGNAVVSTDGKYADQHINPAGIGMPGTLQLSASWDTYTQPLRVAFKQKSISSSYQFVNSAVALSFQYFDTGEQLSVAGIGYATHFKFNNYDYIASGAYSYDFANGFKLGAALNYLYSSPASGTTVSAQFVEEEKVWSIDVGAQYQFQEIDFQHAKFISHVGLALNDFGNSANYYRNDERDPLPTTLRAGGGVKLISNYKMFDQPLLDIILLQNVSKLMVRVEERYFEGRNHYDAMNPFKALVHSWDDYEYFDGQKTQTIELAEQLWWHSGIELKFLNTVSLRWGRQASPQSEEELSYYALGLGIDLYYLSFDYTSIKNEDSGNYLEGSNWQLTCRIPLDGNRPDTILDALFD